MKHLRVENRDLRDLKIDMTGLIFAGLMLACVLMTHETFKALSTTKTNVTMILSR